MSINQAINLNLSSTVLPPVLNMAQYDANSRAIVATLWDGANPFAVPEGSVAMLRFGKPDGTGGLYDETEDGSAITYTGNVVTAPVAAQMLSVAGTVYADIEIYQNNNDGPLVKLSTFCFVINVERAAYSDAKILSNDYYNILSASIKKAIEAGSVVEELSIHPAKIGDSGNWETWDTEANAYVDSGTPARGPDGKPGRVGDPGEKGPPGPAPHIGDNGHWWIDTVDTGVDAKGDKGDKGDGLKIDGVVLTYADLPMLSTADTGKTYLVNADGRLYFWNGVSWPTNGTGLLIKGEDGTTPSIGTNGHWWIGTIDTGVNAQGEAGTPGTPGSPGTPGTDGKTAYEAAQDGGYTGTETQFYTALAAVENKADKSVSATATLTAAGWSNGVQTLAVSGVTAAANGSLRIAQSATDEQFEAWGAAQPRVTAQAAGRLTVKAVGTVPTINIPVEVIVL